MVSTYHNEKFRWNNSGNLDSSLLLHWIPAIMSHIPCAFDCQVSVEKNKMFLHPRWAYYVTSSLGRDLQFACSAVKLEEKKEKKKSLTFGSSHRTSGTVIKITLSQTKHLECNCQPTLAVSLAQFNYGNQNDFKVKDSLVASQLWIFFFFSL